MQEKPEERGVHNPRVVDLVTRDEGTGEVVLVMVEERPWQGEAQLRQVEAKFNAYFEYVVGGHLATQYPQYAELPVRIQLDCSENPRAEDHPFFTAMRNFAAVENIRMVLTVIQLHGEP